MPAMVNAQVGVVTLSLGSLIFPRKTFLWCDKQIIHTVGPSSWSLLCDPLMCMPHYVLPDGTGTAQRNNTLESVQVNKRDL